MHFAGSVPGHRRTLLILVGIVFLPRALSERRLCAGESDFGQRTRGVALVARLHADGPGVRARLASQELGSRERLQGPRGEDSPDLLRFDSTSVKRFRGLQPDLPDLSDANGSWP